MESVKALFQAPFNAPSIAYSTYRSLKKLTLGKGLHGKVVLITGASSGIGRALAHELYKHDCRIIIASRNTESLESLKQELLTSYAKMVVYPPVVVKLDVSDDESILLAANEVKDIFGSIDILINCAGVSHRGSVFDTELKVHKDIMQINYFGPLLLIRELLETLIEQHGHVVNISSIQGLMALPNRSAYCASKHALQAFSDSLRIEMNTKGHNVKITVVSPGYVNTNLSRNARTEHGDKHGMMDAATLSGFDSAYVAKEIVNSICLEEEEVFVAKFSHSVIVRLRHILPSFVFRVLELREAISSGHVKEYVKSWLPVWIRSSYNDKKED